MGNLYRRHDGGNWYGDFQLPTGRRKQISLRTKDRKVAVERLRAAELGATPGARSQVRLMDAIDGMITGMHDKAEPTREMYREKGRRLLKTMGNPLVSEVDLPKLDAYIAKRRSDDPVHGGGADHTIQKELITVRRALKWAVRNNKLGALPPWPEFSPDYQPKKVWLTEGQFARLCAELEPGRRLWASLAALGGMRSGEVERLTWAMVDLDQRKIAVPGTKTDKAARTIPIAPALHALLKEVPDRDRTGPVVAPWGNVRRDLHAAVTRASKKGDALPRISPNDLRRTFASWLVQAGVPLLTVATLMGHSTTRMLEKVYGRLSHDNLSAAVAFLPGGVTNGVTRSRPKLTTAEHSQDGERGRGPERKRAVTRRKRP